MPGTHWALGASGHEVKLSGRLRLVHLSIDKAATAAGEGFALAGVLGLVYESIRHPTKRLTTDRMIEIAGVAGYFALLGSLFGLVFYMMSNGL